MDVVAAAFEVAAGSGQLLRDCQAKIACWSGKECTQFMKDNDLPGKSGKVFEKPSMCAQAIGRA